MTEKKSFDNEQNMALFKEYEKNQSVQTRNKIAELNRPLVTHIVTKYYTSSSITPELKEELLQEGTIGLLSAIDGFDRTLGWKFSTYAYWWIRQAVNNYLVNSCPTIKIPGHIRIAQNKLLKELDEKGINIDTDDLNVDDFDISQKTLKAIRSARKAKYVISLSNLVGGESGEGKTKTLEDTLVSENDLCINKKLDNEVMVSAVKEAIKAMPEKRRLILLLRYGIIKEKDIANGNKLISVKEKEKNEQKI